MQYPDYRATQWQPFQLTKYFLLVAGCLLLWNLPLIGDLCRWLDIQAFKVFNQSLRYSHAWQLLWGYLNHPNETWLNLVWMGLINIIAVFSVPSYKRTKAISLLIYFWIFFQFILLFDHYFFNKFLEVKRESPSMVITPWISLADNLHMYLEVASSHCFPAGHALVLIFWAKFTSLYAARWLKPVLWLTAIMLILPRLFSGAHWLSDIIFTVSYALLWFQIAKSTPLYAYCTEKIERILLIITFRSKVAGTI